jgi:hypothetical protein
MNALKAAVAISLVLLVLGTMAPPAESQTAMPVYKPPLLGAPGGRVGGGTRGPARDMFVLSALAPNHTGTTSTEQPSLFWYISSVTPYPVEVTVVDPQGADPILEKRISAPGEPGVQRIRLADYGVRLAPGVSYRWFVAVVTDPARRSKDILAGGTIERVQPSEELKNKIAQTAKTDLPFLYAEAGLWYDAVTAISELIEAAPQEPGLRKERAAMLAQVGLPEIGE